MSVDVPPETFPMLPLPSNLTPEEGACLQICIVTCDFLGPVRNGGIGTALHGLAQALVDTSHSVTVLLSIGKEWSADLSFNQWAEAYRRQGIALVSSDDIIDELPHYNHADNFAQVSYRIAKWLD
ncbi:MAG TPA: hypothetical protein VD994_01970, partial [Prosthecobacter sp.]|nr:hypothetical protein [Prosthecobacter sp.]